MSLPRIAAPQPNASPTMTAGGGPAAESTETGAATADLAAGLAHGQAPRGRWPMRAIVTVSLLGGLAAAVAGVLLTAGGTEPQVDAAVLIGFAAGWALLGALSVRFTDYPQRWATLPALVLGVGGVALLALNPSSGALDTLGWIWPPALLGMLTWITIRIRRQLPRSGGQWLLYPIVAVTALAAVGGAYHTVSQSFDQASADAPPGQLIDVGDHRLYLSCTGSGTPTVVLEPGLGETSAAWGWIAPAVAAQTQVCVYDRAGRGRSEPSPHAQDSDQIATDLHTLLERARITGPLIIVGHSLGGLYALDYTDRYPQQVAGIVLLDATPPTAFTALPDYPAFYDMFTTVTGLFPGLARLGITQLVNSASHPELPAQARDQARADTSTAGQARSQRDELAMVPTIMANVQSRTDLGDLPLAVLTAPEDAQTGWLAAQNDLAALSSNSTHLIIAGASHESLLDNQTIAAASSQAIDQVISAVHTSTPLR